MRIPIPSRGSLVCFAMAIALALGARGMLFGQDNGPKQAQNQNDKPQETFKLSKSFQKDFETLVKPAYDSGNNEQVYQLLGPVVVKFKQEQLDELEKFGKHHGMDSIRKIIVESHISAVEGGRVVVQPLPLPISIYIGEEVKSRIQSELSTMMLNRVFDSNPRLPEKWNNRELLFWDIHVHRNRLINLQRIAKYAVSIQAPHLKKALGQPKKNAELIAQLNELAEFPQEVEQHKERLALSEAEYHLLQIPIATQTLLDSDDFKDRMYAAFALQDSYAVLTKFYSTNRKAVEDRPALFNDVETVKGNIENWMAEGKASGQDVLEKSIHLRVGTHWWLRGRYGFGPEMFGMLKPAAAMNNPDQMFSLFMPSAPRKPISRYLDQEESQYGFDRRHFYTWAAEYRPVVAAVHDLGTVTTSTQIKFGDSAVFW